MLQHSPFMMIGVGATAIANEEKHVRGNDAVVNVS